jgi:SanA protein
MSRYNELTTKSGKILAMIGLMGAAAAAIILSNVLIIGAAQPFIVPADSAPTGTQAIIVLGAYVRPNGSLSPALRERLETGLDLYQRGGAPKIVVTGDHGTKNYNEVQAMKDYLLDKSVPEQDIFMDHAGFDTYDSLYRARDVFGIKRALVVSQDFHVPRAVYIGRALGLEVYGVNSPGSYPWWFKMVMREWLARAKATFDVELRHPKPKFLGSPIDITGDGRVTQD